MERLGLTAVTRGSGKGVARKLRVKGNIPAILYGQNRKPLPLAVNARDFGKILKASPDLTTTMIDLTIEGGEKALALVRDYQADVFSRAITHLDFQAIDLNKKIDVEVPVNLIGQAIGVKEGGVLEQLRRKIHIRALPGKIPGHIDVDVTNLNIGDSIHADEIQLPEGAEFPHAQNYTVAAVVPPTKEEVAAAPVVAAVEGAPAEGAAPALDAKSADKKEESKDQPAGKAGKKA